MEKLEKVELIRTKTGVSYEDAKNALDACEYDTLDALVYLEKLGKIEEAKTAKFSTSKGQLSSEFENAQKDYESSCKSGKSKEALRKFCATCKDLFRKSCETSFEIYRRGNMIFTAPVILLIICVLFAFWVTIPLLIVGLFMECKYKIAGLEKTSFDINEMCDKASEVCENIKEEIVSNKEQ